MLGIDVSKKILTCTLRDPHSQKTLWKYDLPNTSTGITRLLQLAPPEVSWVLEPTGRYGQEVARGGRAAGRQVLLAQPRKAKKYLESIQDRAKTDRLDSRGLGLYALSRPLPPYPLKPPMCETIDQLMRARKGLSLSIAGLQQRIAELPQAAHRLQAAVAGLELELKGVDADIKQLATKAHNEEPGAWSAWHELQRVPGIGPVTATTIVSCLAAHSFARSDQFVAYCGLDVRVRQSGSRRGSLGLTKQGDAELRRLLYLAALASLRAKDSPFKDQHQRERAKGLCGTAATCAVARKMARLCWSIATHGTTYDKTRIYQHPDEHGKSTSEP